MVNLYRPRNHKGPSSSAVRVFLTAFEGQVLGGDCCVFRQLADPTRVSVANNMGRCANCTLVSHVTTRWDTVPSTLLFHLLHKVDSRIQRCKPATLALAVPSALVVLGCLACLEEQSHGCMEAECQLQSSEQFGL